jgi:hypothetical protein
MKTHTTITQFHEACKTICRNRDKKALNYAVGYAKAGCFMNDPHEVYIQSLYILNNIQYWRGDEAKRIRKILKNVEKA